MPDDYGITINNSGGQRIIDYRYRSHEVIAYGSVGVANRGIARIDFPDCECPLIFLKSNPSAYMFCTTFAGNRSWFYVAADRNTTMSYVIAGFRKASADTPTPGYGLGVYDALGRTCFSSARRYVRYSDPSLNLLSSSFTPSVGAVWDISTTPPVHPNFTNDTYLCWFPRPCWSNSGSVNWYLGVSIWSPTQLSTQRVDMQDSYNSDPNIAIGVFGGPPGNNIAPGIIRTIEFVP